MTITFSTYEKYNDESIMELGLSEAIEDCLRRNNINTIGDIIDRIKDDNLGDIRGIGVTKQKAIKNALFNYELCVSPDPVQFIMDCRKVA